MITGLEVLQHYNHVNCTVYYYDSEVEYPRSMRQTIAIIRGLFFSGLALFLFSLGLYSDRDPNVGMWAKWGRRTLFVSSGALISSSFWYLIQGSITGSCSIPTSDRDADRNAEVPALKEYAGIFVSVLIVFAIRHNTPEAVRRRFDAGRVFKMRPSSVWDLVSLLFKIGFAANLMIVLGMSSDSYFEEHYFAPRRTSAECTNALQNNYNAGGTSEKQFEAIEFFDYNAQTGLSINVGHVVMIWIALICTSIEVVIRFVDLVKSKLTFTGDWCEFKSPNLQFNRMFNVLKLSTWVFALTSAICLSLSIYTLIMVGDYASCRPMDETNNNVQLLFAFAALYCISPIVTCMMDFLNDGEDREGSGTAKPVEAIKGEGDSGTSETTSKMGEPQTVYTFPPLKTTN